uniref:ATP synthase subunit a n=1 Tax=Linguatula arctica TaxID=1346601 RepID=A0A7G8QC91_9CRUS|nr:ATP synthase F0 subunit 6 [Linguatula arctica]QNK04399.1 ATP synthase F0 subunit 6 [Linguatula arctica]
MNSLFSSFNPYISSLSYELIFITPIIILPLTNIWMTNNSSTTPLLLIKSLIIKASQSILHPNLSTTPHLFISIFFMIYILNTSSLFAFIFPLSSHLTFTLSLALPFWINSLIFNFSTSFNNTLAHFTPTATPYPLIPLMIIIEIISTLIQPITLSLRLMANLTAGHLLIILISSIPLSLTLMIPSLLAQALLNTLEIMISFIQAYIFSTLLILYNNH